MIGDYQSFLDILRGGRLVINPYIIDNGFGLEHEVPTSYAHFASHLYNSYLSDLCGIQDDISHERFICAPKGLIEYMRDSA